MLRRRKDPVPPYMEHTAREALYGPHTRSGEVWLTPLFPDEDGRPAGIDALWKDWDSISFDWPENVERFVEGFARAADHNISELITGFAHSVRV